MINQKHLKKIIKFTFIILIVAPLVFVFYCHPIATGVAVQRNLLTCYGLSKKTIKTDQGNLVYFEGGTGKPLILIHGYIADAGNWYPIVPNLVKRYHLIIPDMPGHGESDPQGETLTPEDLLEGILKLIDAKSDSQKVIIVGNSLGGWVALMAVLQKQDRISMLVLENSAGLKTALPERILLPKDVKSARELYQTLLGKEAPHAPDFLYENLITYLAQPRFIYLFNSIKEKYFLDNKLSPIQIPVYMLWGAEDKLFDHEYALRMEKEIPGSRLITIEHTGHAMHFMRPDDFSKRLRNLID